MPMRDRMRIFVLATALALSIAVAPAQASPPAGDQAGVGWWDAVVDALAALFGLDTADGSVCIDPDGRCHS